MELAASQPIRDPHVNVALSKNELATISSNLQRLGDPAAIER